MLSARPSSERCTGTAYRFTAEIEDAEEAVEPAPADIEKIPKPERQPLPLSKLKIPAAITALTAAIVVSWLMFSPSAVGGPVRLAVLPIENATGDAEMDWVSTGLMELMNRVLQDGGVETVSSRDIVGLAGEAPVTALVATGSEFRAKLAKTSAATHVLGARLENNSGLYRLTYTLAGQR